MKNLKTIPPLLAAVAVAALLALPVGSAQAADSLVSRTVVKGTVEQTLGELSKMVADNGMMVMGELHQGKVLAMTGLKTESESIFVGNPAMGKKLFELEPGAGVVVPVRVNIYRNADGRTVVAYIPPSRLLAGFGNPKLDMAAGMLDTKLAAMVGMLGK